MKFKEIETFLKLWLPVIVWAGLIFLFSSRPTGVVSEIHWEDFILKKTLHIVEYAMFTMLLFRALKPGFKVKKTPLILAVIISVVYGITDEYHQSFTPGRQPNLRDVLIDATGSYTFAYFVDKIHKSPKIIINFAEKLGLV